MKIWPFVPLSATESLDWLSDVIEPKSTSQRIALREAPRQGWALSHDLSARQLARARAFAYGIGNDDFGIPIWPEFSRLGAVSAGATSLTFDTSSADYRTSGYALLWEDDETCEAVEVDSVASDSLGLTGTVGASYSDAYIMPLRIGRAPDGLAISRGEGDFSSGSIRFAVSDNIDLSSEAGYMTYRGLPILADVPVIGNGLDALAQRELDQQDGGAGKVGYFESRTDPRQRAKLAWSTADRSELWTVRRFLHARRGRQRAFWAPSWGADVQLLAGIGSADTTLTIEAIGWPDFYGARDILVRTTDGSLYPALVTGGESASDNAETLTLSAAFGTTLSLAQIERVSLMMCTSLDADHIEIAYGPDDGASLSIPCVEAPVP